MTGRAFQLAQIEAHTIDIVLPNLRRAKRIGTPTVSRRRGGLTCGVGIAAAWLTEAVVTGPGQRREGALGGLASADAVRKATRHRQAWFAGLDSQSSVSHQPRR